ncbi:LAFA_0F15126g1_1 [Lachancea sp. 'fantastica']|nr:LAFA_0F15126g1_1 [Lachancea sp. 'fantastica']
MSYVRRDSSGSFATPGIMHHQSKLDVFIIKAHRVLSNNAVINGEDVSVLNTASSSPRSNGPINGSSPHNDLTLFQRLSQLYNATISTSLLDDNSTSPKSAIELFQRFQQIMKELELSYEVSPYGKYFRKLDNGLWQIKDDSELLNDQLWQLVSVSISTVFDWKTGQMLNQNRRRVNSMATSTKNSPSEVIDHTLPQQLQKRLQKLQQDSRHNFYSTSPASPSVVASGNGVRSNHSNTSSGREVLLGSGPVGNPNSINAATMVNNNNNNNNINNQNNNNNHNVNNISSHMVTSMSPGINPNPNSGTTSGMTSGMNSGMTPGLNSGMTPGMNSGTNPSINTNMDTSRINLNVDPSINTSMTSNIDNAINPNIAAAMNTHSNSNFNAAINPSLNNMNLALNMGLEALNCNPQGKRKYVGVGTPDEDAVDELLQLATKKAKSDLPTIEEDTSQQQHRQQQQQEQQLLMRSGKIADVSDVYERLLKEKDHRIKQLEADLDSQRQETRWLQKMLLEDLACVRSMLYKDSRNRS